MQQECKTDRKNIKVVLMYEGLVENLSPYSRWAGPCNFFDLLEVSLIGVFSAGCGTDEG